MVRLILRLTTHVLRLNVNKSLYDRGADRAAAGTCLPSIPLVTLHFYIVAEL